MSKRKTSLESELLKLAERSDPRDRQRRPPVALLAQTLWSRALNGDKNALALLLSRLPVQPAGYYAQPPQETPKAESYQDVADTCRASVEAGLVPAELFQMFTRKPEDVVEH